MINFQDKRFRCRDCGTEFVFTAGEQEFYLRKGLLNPPSRCPNCRALKRERQGGDGEVGGREASHGVGDDGAARRQFYYAVCTECGGEARVPFQPRTDRPVYCSECFERVRVG